MIELVGSFTLAQAFPQVAQAQQKLASASQHIKDQKEDKESELNQLNNKIDTLNTVIDQAQTLATHASNILTAAQEVLNSTDTLLDNLNTALGAAGIYIFKYSGTAGAFGGELEDYLTTLSDPGSSQMVAAKILLVTDGNAYDALSTFVNPLNQAIEDAIADNPFNPPAEP